MRKAMTEPSTSSMSMMMFPGQGAQTAGMGADFAERFAACREIFARADEILGFELSERCFRGPQEELDRTEICQPAILVTSLSIVAAMESDGRLDRRRFGVTAGLSLGEYTALVFAGAMDFADALRLVHRRGRYMQECSDREPSGMVSLLGGDEAAAGEVCRIAGQKGILGVANRNAPEQWVLSGTKAAVDEAARIAPTLGFRRAMPLRVSGAFHSELMHEAGRKLGEDLRGVSIRRPAIRFLTNVTGGFLEEPEAIRRALAEQVTSPVLWERCVRTAIGAGASSFFEPGPSRVLSGLLRKINPDASSAGCERVADLERAPEWAR
jgi:[acyl-carrier-protein] S-malonyltransferase